MINSSKFSILKLAILTLSFVLGTQLQAACMQVDQNSVKLKWTAYKTPLKAGVSGLLKNISLQSSSNDSIASLISSTSFTIATGPKSVDTKNPARDGKISKFFFSSAKDNGKISGKVSSYKKDKLVFEITMNGVTKKVPMKVSIKNNLLTADGHMDILDFSMSESLAKLNKACFALHEGKTWSDVALNLQLNFTACKK